MLSRTLRRIPAVMALLLAIEFLDELVFSVLYAAWPLIRDDLGLSYAQVGLLIGLPNITSAILEPPMGLAGDSRWRRRIVLAGGFAYAAALVIAAGATGFAVLLVAFLVLYPASGAFVALSQATLVDTDPGREEQLMARWTLAGSVGVVAGPIVLGGAALGGLDWRQTTVAMAIFALSLAVFGIRTFPGPKPKAHDALPPFASMKAALARARTWRWLALLTASDLMLDVLFGFVALYIVDVAGGSQRDAGLAVLLWVSVGLAGDILLLPLLERFRGLSYLRFSAAVTIGVYAAFLLVPWLPGKFALLAVLGLINAGWYAILQGQFYKSLPGQSGVAVAIGSGFGSITGFIPVGIGALAAATDLQVAMWLLLAGPVVIALGIPRDLPEIEEVTEPAA